jgi:hypothetical protein
VLLFDMDTQNLAPLIVMAAAVPAAAYINRGRRGVDGVVPLRVYDRQDR